MSKYEDYDWEELEAEVKAAAEVLGYTKELWDNDGEPEKVDQDWSDLSAEEKAAAQTLGFTEETWDAE